jgi:hypothetical protein
MTNINKFNYFEGILRNQIEKYTNSSYVILKLHEKKEVEELSELLQKKNIIKYIIEKFNRNSIIKDSKRNMWYLCISGFKYGAKKDSPRKLGLIAIKLNYHIDNFLKKFKTRLLYTSILFDKPGDNIDYISKHIKHAIESYLKSETKYNEETNYITNNL